jgi:hypothetical protein
MIAKLLIDWASAGKSVTALAGLLTAEYLKSRGVAIPQAVIIQLVSSVLGIVGIIHKCYKYATVKA